MVKIAKFMLCTFYHNQKKKKKRVKSSKDAQLGAHEELSSEMANVTFQALVFIFQNAYSAWSS